MSKPFKTPQQVVYVCTGSKCKKRGGKELSKLFRDRIKSAGLQDTVDIIKTDCTDRCKFAPVISLQPQNIWLPAVTELQAVQVFQQYVQPSPVKPENPAVAIAPKTNAPADA